MPWSVGPEHFRHGGRVTSPHHGGVGLDVGRCVRVVRVYCWRIALGHMGATPQPKRTAASHDNQRRKCRNSGISNLSEVNQPSGESIDTVGVTGSIPVSPTLGGPVFRGLQSFPDLSGAVLGIHERWLRWIATVRPWPRCVPTSHAGVADRTSRRAPPRHSAAIRLRNRDLWLVLDGEEIVRHE
jgi:hypothetical protein